MTIATASLVDVLVGATTDVFETMVFRQLVPGVTAWGHATRPKSQIVGTVGFAGSSTGLVAFHLSIAAARDMTVAMLGIELDEDGLPDAVGEVTNMIAGAFRTRMAAFQDAWAISVPTVTVGSDFYIKPISTGDRVIVAFAMDTHQLFVELIITPNADAAA
ncbi:MAG: chemotaxis protein CheX [Vicinamibacteraceae bacterium]